MNDILKEVRIKVRDNGRYDMHVTTVISALSDEQTVVYSFATEDDMQVAFQHLIHHHNGMQAVARLSQVLKITTSKDEIDFEADQI